MKIANTTDFPVWVLRRMVVWCCGQLSYPVRRLSRAQFGNRTNTPYSGRAYRGGHRILVRVGSANHFPHVGFSRGTRRLGAPETLGDRTEALVLVTAHEVRHCLAYLSPADYGNGEAVVDAAARRVLSEFRRNRDALLAAWNEPPKVRTAKPKPSRQQRNDAKARDALTRWERKLKLAKTKVAAYRQRVRYYDKAAAMRSESTGLTANREGGQ